MAAYIALLRGINVSGHKLIKMTELKAMFESLGFAQVQTYIQSGNVLFDSNEDPAVLRQRLESEIQTVFGFQVPVVVRTVEQMEQTVTNCPFTANALQPEESLYVSLLAEEPSHQGIDRLLACNSEIDEFRIHGSDVYILLRQSIRKSLFTNNFLERKLGVPATTRNWQTMNKLVALGKNMA
jgi:uncharacterized protein (DUF1697 family)